MKSECMYRKYNHVISFRLVSALLLLSKDYRYTKQQSLKLFNFEQNNWGNQIILYCGRLALFQACLSSMFVKVGCWHWPNLKGYCNILGNCGNQETLWWELSEKIESSLISKEQMWSYTQGSVSLAQRKDW